LANESIRMKSKKITKFSGLDLLSSAVVLINSQKLICYINSAANQLFGIDNKSFLNSSLEQLAGTYGMLTNALENAIRLKRSYVCYDIPVPNSDATTTYLDCTVTPVAADAVYLLLEFRPIDYMQQSYREFIRNLASEIKNPLCSIRVSAQLLESELDKLDNAPVLREYTQVTMKEVDRLQDLMQILLSSHRAMQQSHVSIYDTLEHVRGLIQTEYSGVQVRRDYDNSIPDITGEKEHLTQAIFNIARDAAQAMGGKGEIVFHACTVPSAHAIRATPPDAADQDLISIARDAALIMKNHNEIVSHPHTVNRLALARRRIFPSLKLQIIQDETGVHELARKKKLALDAASIDDANMGLMLARSFIKQHQGKTATEYRRGRTYFTIRLPSDGYAAIS